MGRFTYGPVPSRRLGRSLGIDLVASKSCTVNCIYCQIGSREPSPPVRVSFFPPEDIEADIRSAVESADEIDWLTFSGSGEPTLSSDLGRIVRFSKSLDAAPVCVLTNGTLLWMPEVRQEISDADLVVPNLDAATPELFEKVVRPHSSITFEKYYDGLKTFSTEFEGDLHLEIVVLKGINDSEEHFRQLAELVEDIAPSGVWIGTVKRPPAESYVQAVSDETLELASEIIGGKAEIIHDYHGKKGETFSAWGLADKIIDLLRRRPETAEAIAEGLSANYHEALKAISRLEEAGKIHRREIENRIYYDITRT
ncbi:MAG: radical SAM protein [bacterium]